MKTALFQSKSEKWISKKSELLNGNFDITYDYNFQPFGSLIEHGNKESPLNASASIGIKLISSIKIKGVKMFEVASKNNCVLYYNKPQNKEEVFKNFISESINSHISQYSKIKSDTIFNKSKDPSQLYNYTNQIYESLNDHFHSLFE